MIREEQKAETRKRIIDSTFHLIKEKGFLKISSKDIAKSCNVAQGSIFLHFGTKIDLLNHILGSNIESYEDDLKRDCLPDLSRELFLKSLLDTIEKHEDILARIYKDYSYLDTSLTKSIDNAEVLLKNLLFSNYKLYTKEKVNIVDSFIAIDAFLSQIKEYLISKDTFSTVNSVIRQKRGRLLKLYRMLFV
jgi:AcrR family transcriptional regulator